MKTFEDVLMQFFRLRHTFQKKKRERGEGERHFESNSEKYLRIATEKKTRNAEKVAHRLRQFKESAGRIKHAIASRNHQFLRPKLAFSIHTCFE